MALSAAEKREMNQIASRIRRGEKVTAEEDKRLDELQDRMGEDLPPMPKIVTIYDLPIARSMWAADKKAMGW